MRSVVGRGLRSLPLRVLAFALVVVAALGRPGGGSGPVTTRCDTSALTASFGSTFAVGSRFTPIGGISLGTGWFRLQTVDLQPARTLASTFLRSYSSGDTRTTAFGPGWMNSSQVRLRMGNATDLLVTFADGATERFAGAATSGHGTGQSRPYRSIDDDPGRGWVVRDNGRVWTFNTSGDLVRIDDPSGDWAELRYEGSTVRSTVGPEGPGLLFEMGADRRMTKVSSAKDPTMFATYEYDAVGRLVRAAPAIGGRTRFTYRGQTQQLASITDDAGKVLLQLEYDETGQVIRDQDALGAADGEALTFAYEELSGGGRRTTATYPVSTIEPGWHPIQIEIEDAQFRTRSLELRPTSWAVLVGHYDWDAVNHRIALDPRPCPPLDAPPSGTPGAVAVAAGAAASR